MRTTITVLCLLGAAAAARGDTVTFPSGGQMKGVVLSQNDDQVVLRIRHGLMTLNPTQIASITKEDTLAQASSRLAPWDACFMALRTRKWGPELRPTVALVIDSGPFKNVPYERDMAGAREFSIYGDPDSPAGFEVGLTKSLCTAQDARKEASEVLASFLSDPKDREVLASLKLGETGKAERGDLIFEVEQGQNAEGVATWWLSVYNVRALEAARVSGQDLPKPAVAPEPSRSGDTVAAPKTTTKGEPQEVISPFGTEPEDPKQNPRRRYSRGGANWGHYWHSHTTSKPHK
jgi:hypothetical protein